MSCIVEHAWSCLPPNARSAFRKAPCPSCLNVAFCLGRGLVTPCLGARSRYIVECHHSIPVRLEGKLGLRRRYLVCRNLYQYTTLRGLPCDQLQGSYRRMNTALLRRPKPGSVLGINIDGLWTAKPPVRTIGKGYPHDVRCFLFLCLPLPSSWSAATLLLSSQTAPSVISSIPPS